MAQVPLTTRFIGISENVNLEEKKSAVLNSETQPYTIADLVSTIGTGAQGPQGVQGPAGPVGPVGPAGLEWQGAWVSGTTYFENDAVGYNGASYFLFTADNVGSQTEDPITDNNNWALLASQGAIGPQGAQGPTGPQGVAGSVSYTEGSRNATSISLVQNPAHTGSKIVANFTRVYVPSAVNNFIGLSNLGVTTGEFFVVQNKSTTNNLVVVPLDGAMFLQPNGFDSQTNFTVGPNRYARFTLADNTSGSDKVFMIEIINPLGANSGGSQTHKIWRASVKQTSGGPSIVTVFENTLGGSVTIANDTFGSGFILSTSALFTNLKTFAPSTTYHANGLVFSLYPTVNSTSQITYATKKTSDNGDGVPYSDNLIYIEVIVYN